MKSSVYTFRVLLDSDGEAYRDIELSSDSSFKDLHLAIVDSVKFDGNELASFYICDDNWKRKTEIALMEMDDISGIVDEEEENFEEEGLDDEELDDDDIKAKGKKNNQKGGLRKVEDDEDVPAKGKKSKKEKILVMNDETLDKHISKNGQKLIYIYDYYELWTFYVELTKMGEKDPKASYPRCTKKVGKLPEKTTSDIGLDDDELELEGLEEFSSSTKKKGAKSKKADDDLEEDFNDDFDDDMDDEFEDGYDDEDIDRFSKYN